MILYIHILKLGQHINPIDKTGSFTHPLYEFSDHAIPLSRLVVSNTVDLIWGLYDDVMEADDVSDFSKHVHAEAFVPLVTREVAS